MIKYFYILLLISFNSFSQEKKTLEFKVNNCSSESIDSLKIVLNDNYARLNTQLKSDSNEIIEMKIEKNNRSENVFIIYYYINEKSYWANFGYHLGNNSKNKYSIYIFNEGVSEINKLTPHTKDNKHLIIK